MAFATKGRCPGMMMEIRTRRLVLRPLKKSDYKTWFDCQVNSLPAQNKWDSGQRTAKECSRLKYQKLIGQLKALAKKDEYYRFGVFHKTSKALVAEVDFNIYCRGTLQFANFGYFVYNRHWGKGYGQEAAAAGLKIGFQQLKLNRLEAAINLDNKKSILVAKSIGMKREGIKKRYWYEHGDWVDNIIYVANPEDLGLKSYKPF